MQITIGSFGGIVPRLSPHQLASFSASIAHDAKLRNGRLEAWKEKCYFADTPPSALTFHLHGCCVTTWDTIVQSAEVAPDWNRFYITGRTEDPEVVELNCTCEPTYTKLGVPAPMVPPVANGPENCSRSSDARSYVYTYLNKWGEESAPSPASNILTIEDGTTVFVSGMELPPDGYGIVAINLYRATTGFREPDVKQQKPLTDYLYLATIELPSTSFEDNVRMAGLGAAIDTQKVRMPPKGLRNIVAMEGVVRLAGTTKNRVHMTENFQLHNWPVKYDLTLDSNIVHMGALEQKLYVTTDTTPYIIDVSSCEDMKCMPVMDAGVALPDIACKYADSAIMTQHGYIYSSPRGLILLDGQARYHILTKKWFSEDDWAQLKPDTVRLAYWEGFLFCITDEVSFMLNIDTDPYGDMRGSELVTLSDKPVDMKTSNTGELFLMQDGELTVWDKGLSYRPFTWVSRELTQGQDSGQGQVPDLTPAFGALWSPSSVKIRSDDVEFTLITPVTPEAYKRKVLQHRPFRLPRVGRHLWFKVRLRGIHPVEFLEVGTANFTVNQGA